MLLNAFKYGFINKPPLCWEICGFAMLMCGRWDMVWFNVIGEQLGRVVVVRANFIII